MFRTFCFPKTRIQWIGGVNLEYLNKNCLKIEKSQAKVPKEKREGKKYRRSRH